MSGMLWVESVLGGPMPERRRSLGVSTEPAERMTSCFAKAVNRESLV